MGVCRIRGDRRGKEEDGSGGRRGWRRKKKEGKADWRGRCLSRIEGGGRIQVLYTLLVRHAIIIHSMSTVHLRLGKTSYMFCTYVILFLQDLSALCIAHSNPWHELYSTWNFPADNGNVFSISTNNGQLTLQTKDGPLTCPLSCHVMIALTMSSWALNINLKTVTTTDSHHRNIATGCPALKISIRAEGQTTTTASLW